MLYFFRFVLIWSQWIKVNNNKLCQHPAPVCIMVLWLYNFTLSIFFCIIFCGYSLFISLVHCSVAFFLLLSTFILEHHKSFIDMSIWYYVRSNKLDCCGHIIVCIAMPFMLYFIIHLHSAARVFISTWLPWM